MLTQEELGGMTCCECGCGGHEPLFLNSRCHPGDPARVSYHPEGYIQVVCDTCNKTIAQIEVARGAAIPEFSQN